MAGEAELHQDPPHLAFAVRPTELSRALSNQEKGFTAVMVVHKRNRVVGYYGLAPTAVVASVLPRAIRTGQPPDPVPCLLLGQLATDQAWKGKGIGTGLIKHALERSVTAARLIGGRALVVNGVDHDAADFWRRRGFVPSKDDPLVLFRSMADIAASLDSVGYFLIVPANATDHAVRGESRKPKEDSLKREFQMGSLISRRATSCL